MYILTVLAFILVGALASIAPRADPAPTTYGLPALESRLPEALRPKKPEKPGPGCGANNLGCAGGLLKFIDCYMAMNKIDPDHRYINWNRFDRWKEAGVCHKTCWLRVSGKRWDRKDRCDLSGREMIDMYMELQEKKCYEKCGVRESEDGCLFRMEYIDPEDCWMTDSKYYSGNSFHH